MIFIFGGFIFREFLLYNAGTVDVFCCHRHCHRLWVIIFLFCFEYMMIYKVVFVMMMRKDIL